MQLLLSAVDRHEQVGRHELSGKWVSLTLSEDSGGAEPTNDGTPSLTYLCVHMASEMQYFLNESIRNVIEGSVIGDTTHLHPLAWARNHERRPHCFSRLSFFFCEMYHANVVTLLRRTL